MPAKGRRRPRLELDASLLLVRSGSDSWRFATDDDEAFGRPLGEWPIRVAHDGSRGDHCVASRDLCAGALICWEEPFAQTVHDSVDDAVCHVCYEFIRAEPYTTCTACGQVRYCSQRCAALGQSAHHSECFVLRQLAASAASKAASGSMGAGSGVRGLRFFMRLVNRIAEEPDALRVLEENLQEHFGDAAPERRRFLLEMAAKVNRLVPPPNRMGDELRLAHLISRAHVNLHSVSDCGGVTYGSGLYPRYGSKFNHSCAPSAVVSFHGRTWRLHTLRAVGRGEEITIAYTDLYAGRERRRAALRATKSFECACRRCRHPPASDAEIDGWVADGLRKRRGRGGGRGAGRTRAPPSRGGGATPSS